MKGPTAPKDPEKRRPFFYIIRDKEVFGAKTPDGRGIQFIYENDGRLINSARIVGNITDEKILELLKTTRGLQKLVHSIGVSVETAQQEEPVKFVFQMYGKKDIYGGGTLLCEELKGDGMERKICLKDVNWREDDYEPGQIRLEFETPEQLAKVSVRFYLNDGYEAPEVLEETKVDVSSADYRAMIERSLMQLGDTRRIKNMIERAKAGEDVTIAYIGGSITQGAGATPIHTQSYAYQSWHMFDLAYGNGNNVHLVKAGVGGTPSELGMLRFERDVVRDGVLPDLVVIEFAVNDEGDETKGRCYESLVRKVLALPNHPAVILLFAVFASDWNLQTRLAPVGEKYRLPMVSILDAVCPQFGKKAGEGRVISKNQFFYDVFHPSNIGHTIMADCLMNLIYRAEKEAVQGEETPYELSDITPVIGGEFAEVKLLDKKDACENAIIDCGGFTGTDTELQCVEMDDSLTPVPEFPYNWMYDGSVSEKPYFEMKLDAKAILLIYKDSGAMDVAKADVYVDGKKVFLADPHENGWVHCNPKIICEEKESREHTVRIQIAPGDEQKKFTILGFGYVK